MPGYISFLPLKPFCQPSVKFSLFDILDMWARPMRIYKIPISHNLALWLLSLCPVGPSYISRRRHHLASMYLSERMIWTSTFGLTKLRNTSSAGGEGEAPRANQARGATLGNHAPPLPRAFIAPPPPRSYMCRRGLCCQPCMEEWWRGAAMGGALKREVIWIEALFGTCTAILQWGFTNL
jgi:hypothetical protein